ncbi:hypothetical protein A8B82_07615 [Sulfitobacter sp. EhC04]|nr:hypothetical protein A8B82_07615 [Sulfitobacter sp. EhC04]
MATLLVVTRAGAQRRRDLSISLDLRRAWAYPIPHDHDDLQNTHHYYLLRFLAGVLMSFSF